MRVTEISVRRPVGVAMGTLAVMALGIVAILRMPVDLLPDIEYPRVAIVTSFPPSSPEEVERLVTDVIEQQVSTVRGLRRYTSVTTSDKSRVTLEFGWGTKMEFARLEIREKLDRARWSLPDEAGRPTLVEFDPSRRPFMTIALVREGDPVATSDLARRVIGPRLEQAEGVAAVEIDGQSEPAFYVRLEPEILTILGLTAEQVGMALRRANLRLPGGMVSEGHKEFYLMIDGEFNEVDDVSKVVVARRGPTPVLLGDISTLSVEPKPLHKTVRLNGKRCLLLRLRKMAGTNTVQVASGVRESLEALRREIPEIELFVIDDDAGFISEALTGVKDALLIGGVLAFAILFLFLGDWRSPVLLGIAIPISLLFAFVGLFLTGTSVNIMSLGGMALGVGLLVDNAIVVLEAIHRRREEGLGGFEAAISGTKEVGPAILASTLTTIVVFLPVIYVEGVAGQIFQDQALAVTFALLASLIAAITLLPTMSARIMGSSSMARTRRDLLTPARDQYLKALSWALDHRRVLLSGCTVLFVLAVIAARFPSVELLPSVETSAVDVELSVPPGTPFDRLAQIASDLEEDVRNQQGVARVLARLGLRGDPEAVDALLAVYGDGSVPTAVLGERVSTSLAQARGQTTWKRRTTLLEEILGSGSHDLSVILSGKDLSLLKADAEVLEQSIDKLPSVANASLRWLPGAPEMACTVDLDLADAVRVTPNQVAQEMQAAARGLASTTYHREDERIDVMLLSGEGEGIPWEKILSHEMVTVKGPIPLRRLLRWRLRSLPGEIEHVGGERSIRLLVDAKGANLGGASREIAGITEQLSLSDKNGRVFLGPEVQEMRRSLSSLILAAILAIGLVYALLAGQFESFLFPFPIMLTVPLGLVGVVTALLITGTGWGVMSGIGVVVLAGIVVNDGILLADRARQLMAEGLAPRDAFLGAGSTRFRPVVMTTVTTVLGLLPMALGIGPGAELRSGLAITIIGGILAATFLTLLVIPAFYLMMVRE